ncbi:MAG: hypothetical protein ACT4PZ_06360 [Panacagrimonas sp.]
MKSKILSAALVSAGLVLCVGSVSAQEGEVGGVFLKAGDNSQVKVPGVDKDGDGCLSKAEVTPGGQLDKRFPTRDTNGDGKLCKDEYYTP